MPRLQRLSIKLLFVLAVFVYASSAQANNVILPISDIPELINGEAPDDVLRIFLAQEIQRQLDAAGFQNESGVLLTQYEVPAISQELASFCLIPRPKHVVTDPSTATVTLDNNTQFILDLPDLKSISVIGEVTGAITMATPARVKWGQAVPFVGSCKTIATDSGVISVSLSFVLSINASVDLELSYDPELVAIVVDKDARIDASLNFFHGDIDPEFGNLSITEVLIELFENRLLDEVDDLATTALAQSITTLNHRLNGNNALGLPDPTITPFNGPTSFVLEQDADDLPFVRALLDELGLPDLVISLVEGRGIEILAQLAVLDEQGRTEFLAELGVGLACDAVLNRYQKPLDHYPLFQQTGNSCVISKVDNEGSYFVDAQCSQEIAFEPTSIAEFCARRASEQAGELLGNALSWSADSNQPNDPLPNHRSRPWSLLPGTTLDLGIVPLDELHQPFIKQVEYKVINDTGRRSGVCALEMRVYKKDLGATNLKPLMAIHGGTWQNRGFSFLGLESSLARFAEDDFIVFAPFYRLAGDSDGNPECNGVTWREVIADIQDALQWIRDHGQNLGSANMPVTLFGQSAGAHLASWLASYQSQDVAQALLMYPPLDHLDFINNALETDSTYQEFRDFGLRALAAFFGSNNGLQELRLDLLPPGLEKVALTNNPDAFIPNNLFNLATPNPGPYLANCATQTNTDLDNLNPQSPPDELLQCLKRELADFLSLNSFFDTLQDVPIQVIHGSNDTLVPYQQAIRLCANRSGNPLSEELSDALTTYACGINSAANIVLGGDHALDLGPCIGPLCPAGNLAAPSRGATDQALASAYTWLGLTRPQVPDSPYLVTVSDSNGNGSHDIALFETTGSIKARIFDPALGSETGLVTYLNDQWSFERSMAFPEGNLGVLAKRDDVVVLAVAQLATNNTRLSYPMGAGWSILDAASIDANNAAFLAIRISDGLPIIEVKNIDSDQRIRLIYPLNKNWRVKSLQILSGPSNPIIAILAEHVSNKTTIIQFRNLNTGALLGNSYPVGNGWVSKAMKTITDTTLAVSMIRNSDGLEVIQLFDSSNQTLIRNVYPIGAGSHSWITHTLAGLDNNGKTEISILSASRANGSMLAQIKDPDSGLVLNNTWFIPSPWLFQRGFAVLPDYSGNNVSEISVLTENIETGHRMIQTRDALTGVVLTNLDVN